MGHQPTADISHWFAPTSRGTAANHRLTLSDRTVPTRTNVPPRKNKIRCFENVSGAHEAPFVRGALFIDVLVVIE